MRWFRDLKIPENCMTLEPPEKLKLVLNVSENVKSTAQFILNAFNVKLLVDKISTFSFSYC